MRPCLYIPDLRVSLDSTKQGERMGIQSEAMDAKDQRFSVMVTIQDSSGKIGGVGQAVTGSQGTPHLSTADLKSLTADEMLKQHNAAYEEAKRNVLGLLASSEGK